MESLDRRTVATRITKNVLRELLSHLIKEELKEESAVVDDVSYSNRTGCFEIEFSVREGTLPGIFKDTEIPFFEDEIVPEMNFRRTRKMKAVAKSIVEDGHILSSVKSRKKKLKVAPKKRSDYGL